MGFAVLHSEKGQTNASSIGKHIDREQGAEQTFPHADPKIQNIDLTPPKWKGKDLQECINDRIKEGYTGKKAIRKDAVRYLTHVLTGSHDEMKDIFKNEKTKKEWCQKNYDFLCKEFGAENIVRISLHLDEKTPHLHAVTVPLTENGRLSAKEIVGNRTEMSDRQTRYADQMKEFGLERGIKGTGIKHETAKEYYTRINQTESAKNQVLNRLDQVFDENKIRKRDITSLPEKNEALRTAISNFIEKEVREVAKTEIVRNQALKSEIKDIQKDVAYKQFIGTAHSVKKDVDILDYFSNKVTQGKLRFEGRKGNEFYFATPHQKTGSIAVNPRKQTFFDHNEGKGGDLFRAIGKLENLPNFNQQVKFGLDISTVVKEQGNQYKQELKNTTNDNKKAQITTVFDEIQHPSLKNYMKKRGISDSIFLKEVHWNIGQKSYFALGWKNDKGGFDLRNEHYKGKLGTNDITTGFIGKKEELSSLAVFEGMTDYLSYRKNKPDANFEFIVLNSTSNTDKAIENIKNSKSANHDIYLFLDKDEAGNKATNQFKAHFKNSDDMREHYVKNSKDLNEHYSIKNEMNKSKNKGMSR
jgi:5S rRNA maturation endonuclease (ribonuclease M5)/gas vesicle protein